VKGKIVKHPIYTKIIMFPQTERTNLITDELSDLLGYYAALGSNSVPTFPDNLSAPSPRSRSPKFFLDFLGFKKNLGLLDPLLWDR
jgi:hypothetical protein